MWFADGNVEPVIDQDGFSTMPGMVAEVSLRMKRLPASTRDVVGSVSLNSDAEGSDVVDLAASHLFPAHLNADWASFRRDASGTMVMDECPSLQEPLCRVISVNGVPAECTLKAKGVEFHELRLQGFDTPETTPLDATT